MRSEPIEAVSPAGHTHPQLLAQRSRKLLSTSALCTAALLAFGGPAQAVTQINSVETVIGTGGGTQASPWNVNGLFVGYNKNGTLNISDGGAVNSNGIDGFGVLGYSLGVTGTVTVDGAGSTWTNAQEIEIGYGAAGILNITNGGAVSSGLTVTIGNSGGGTVTVDGAGSTLTSANNIYVGAGGTGTLNVTDGGAVSGYAGYIGSGSGGTGTATVTGTGSTWTSSSALYVGYRGTGALTIADGAEVSVGAGSGTVTLGNYASGNGTLNIGAAAGDAAAAAGTLNAATLAFGSGTGTLVFNHTEYSYEFAADISGNGTINNLSGMTNLTGDSSGFTGVTNADGGALVVTGTLGGSAGYVGSSAGTSGAVSVLGVGASWTASSLSVGYSGTGSLTIASGGTVSNTDAYVGYNSSGDGTVTVTGAGSNWGAENGFRIGVSGTGTLNILDGATAGVLGDSFIGYMLGSDGTVNVSGDGSSFEAGSYKIVVSNGGNGTLNITDGGAVSSANGVIGAATGSGAVMVDGAGSKWTNAQSLVVGNWGDATLTIANDGVVSATDGVIISAVMGTGTLNIGAAAGDTATGAGTLDTASVAFGTGTGTLVFNHTDTNYVFAPDISGSGTINHLAGNTNFTGDSSGFTGTTYADGGVLTITGTLGGISGVVGNTAGMAGEVSVAGATANWTMTGTLDIGSSGNGTLTVADGGTLSSSSGYIAYGSDVTGSVTVTGTDSTWTTSSSLYVGDSGTGSLTIEDGGAVSSKNGYVGEFTSANGTATVTGAGSSWAIVKALTIGDAGTGVLKIENGGTVSDEYGYVGLSAGSTGAVTVDGAGSTWANSKNLIVGISGAGTLTISNGGVASSNIGYIGYLSGSDATATVTGSGSIWNTSTTIIGDLGTGALTIADSGAVITDNGYLGAETGTGTVTVTGSGSKWTSSQDLVVGDFAIGALTIADGGVVSVASSGSGGFYLARNAGSTGTLNIGAAAGDAAAAAGTLDTASVAFGTGTGTLNFNHTETAYTFSSDITGSGTINHLAGVTKLTGDASGFTGTTNITGGSLYVNNALGGTVNVSGGTLGGSGTLSGDVSVTTGTIAAGNSPGTLTIGGNLTLASSSSLDFELGSPSGTAGVDSDLIVVGGNLTLDGTLNVADAGGFGAGVYRLIDYSGTLTDNGLDVGTMPADFLARDLTVQTAVANQVNLIVSGPSGLSFWDGANLTANGAVDGGSGTWNATNTNWTNSTGTTNGAFYSGVMQVFQGTGGTVSVDNGDGVVTTSAMQFAADGYTISGDDLTLSGSATIRVGDGTTAGASYTTNIAASLIGTGSLEKTDLGTLTLTGTNSYSGGTTISGGTLIGNATSLQGDIANNASLTFNQASDGTYAGMLSGSGVLTKAGAGELILTGDSSAYTGTTDIAAGLLTINGTLGGTVNVSGGTLGGSGTLGTVAIASGGTIAPGNSVGTLNVGNLTIASGSTYTVELNESGFVAGTNNDLLNASGTVTINGGTVYVTAENGTDDGSTYTPGTYTIITAGSLTGVFDSVTDDFAYLDFAASYDYTLNEAYLTSSLSATSFCLSSMSDNECATGDGVYSLGSGDSVFDAVLTLSDADAAEALDQLSGEVHASAQTALLEDSRFAREAALDRLRAALGGADANGGQTVRETPEGTNIWAQGFGSWSGWGGDGNAANMSRNIGGLFMGADAEISDNVTLGLMGGYARSGVSVSDRMSSGTVDSYTLGAYAGGNWDGFSLKGGAAYSWNALDTSRSVDFTGFSDSLSASYNAHTFQAYTEAAYTFDAGSARFEPFANLAYVNLSTDGFTETGGAAALTAAGQVVNATFTTLGIRGETDIDLGATAATLSGGLGWRHVFGNTPTSQMSFASGGNAFTVAGVPLAQDVLVLDAGFNVNLTDNATLGLSYSGQFGSNLANHAAKASFNVRF